MADVPGFSIGSTGPDASHGTRRITAGPDRIAYGARGVGTAVGVGSVDQDEGFVGQGALKWAAKNTKN